MKLNNLATLATLSLGALAMTSCSEDKKQDAAPAAKPAETAEAAATAEPAAAEEDPTMALGKQMIAMMNDMADIFENLNAENAPAQIEKLKALKEQSEALEGQIASLTPEQVAALENNEELKAEAEKVQARIETAMMKLQEDEDNAAVALMLLAAMAGEEMPDMEEEPAEVEEPEAIEEPAEVEEPEAIEEPAEVEETEEIEEDIDAEDDTEEEEDEDLDMIDDSEEEDVEDMEEEEADLDI